MAKSHQEGFFHYMARPGEEIGTEAFTQMRSHCERTHEPTAGQCAQHTAQKENPHGRSGCIRSGL
eukprot:3057050-Ditylum_brightwellii.AAC.1